MISNCASVVDGLMHSSHGHTIYHVDQTDPTADHFNHINDLAHCYVICFFHDLSITAKPSFQFRQLLRIHDLHMTNIWIFITICGWQEVPDAITS